MLHFSLKPSDNINKPPSPHLSFEEPKQIFLLYRTSPLVTPASPSANFWRKQMITRFTLLGYVLTFYGDQVFMICSIHFSIIWRPYYGHAASAWKV